MDTLPENLKTWPERIYLQNTDEEGPMPYDEAMRYEDVVTWCDMRQETADVEYVRADLATAAQEPAGWRDFLVRLSEMEGSMVNGNRLSLAAKELLAK